MNVPKLRFPAFKNNWYQDTLKNISNEIAYGMNSASKDFDGENYYIRITDIDENTGKYLKNDKVSPDGILEDKFLVKDNDILFARTGASTGKTYLYSKDDGKLYYAGFLIKANIKNDINSNFIYQQTKINKYNKWVKIMSMRSGQPGINSEEYGSYKFSITDKNEQDMISNLLLLLDKKIELQSKKIEALKLYKLCIMQNIFSKANMKVKLGKIADIFKGKQVNSEELLPNGKYYMLNGGITPSGYLNEYNTLENTITISEGGNSCGYVNFNKVKFWCGGHCYSLNDIKIDNNYLYQALKLNENKLMKLRVGSGLPNIQKKDLENFEFNIHDSAKQNIISNCLNKYDYKIELEIKLLESLMQLKKGLMQSMFV